MADFACLFFLCVLAWGTTNSRYAVVLLSSNCYCQVKHRAATFYLMHSIIWISLLGVRVKWKLSLMLTQQHLPVRNGVVNRDCKIANYHVALPLQCIHLHLSIHTFFELVFCKIFWTLLGYTVTKAPANPRNSTWFTRSFLLVIGRGLGTRLVETEQITFY